MGTRIADSRLRGFRNETATPQEPVGEKVEPTTRFGEAEILRPLIPGTGLAYVGGYSTRAKAGEHRGIIGGAHRQRCDGVAGFGGALKDDAGGDEIAGRGEFLTLLDQQLDFRRRFSSLVEHDPSGQARGISMLFPETGPHV